ncbi:hypothetical protein BC941DRAFT_439524 [Chlamydoabsidia padenii]|nr:hypothetical protein BC941DRAFT_439524 [Chlamydoabsidia padenii]
MASSTTSTQERIFLLGATGTVGQIVARKLALKKVPLTVYVRNPDKASTLFSNIKQPGNDTNFGIVKGGDYTDLTSLKAALPGHTRLFLLVKDLARMPEYKENIAKLAYAAGIKQIVDVSCSFFGGPWRDNYITYQHELAERAILAIPNRGRAVSLRPTFFMSNMIVHYRPSHDHFADFLPPDSPRSWVSPNDIADVAVAVLTEPDLDKHGDCAYELTSDVATPTRLAEILSKASGRPITYRQITSLERYNVLKDSVPWPFRGVFDLATLTEANPHVSLGIPILLGREPESLDAYFSANKQDLL